jgi:cytochrome P450
MNVDPDLVDGRLRSRSPIRVRRREQPRIILQLLTTPHRALDTLRERYGPVCALGAGPLRMVLVGDPVALTELFRKPTEQFRWRHRFNWFDVLVGSSSMLTNDEPEHKRLRSAVLAGFGRRRLNRWIPMIIERTDAAIDRLLADPRPDEVVDLEPVLRTITMEVVLAALFGAHFSTRATEIAERRDHPTGDPAHDDEAWAAPSRPRDPGARSRRRPAPGDARDGFSRAIV